MPRLYPPRGNASRARSLYVPRLRLLRVPEFVVCIGELAVLYVYVSGPLRGSPGDSPEVNVRQALAVGSKLMDEGLVPFVPQLAWYMNGYHPREEVEWLNHYALPWLERCDAVLRFGGPSKGADVELKLAEKLGKPIFMAIPQVIVWKESQE